MFCVKRTEVVSPLGINSEGSGQSPLAELGSLWGAAGHPRSVPPDLLHVSPQVLSSYLPPGVPCVSSAVPQVSPTQEIVPRVPPGLERSGLRISTQRCVPVV